MPRPLNLDMDTLRTFVTGFELGTFARAADRLGRSQSAISTQLRKLELQVRNVSTILRHRDVKFRLGQPRFLEAG